MERKTLQTHAGHHTFARHFQTNNTFMKKHSAFLLPALLSIGLMRPSAAVAQDPCDGLSVVVESGCLGEDIGWAVVDQVIGATNPTNILWSTGETVQFVPGLPNGDHWVMVTDANGCWDKVDFTIDCSKDEEPCQLRTQTMGGWGAVANGNNPATYRDANFAAAFPGGLTIGCTNTLTLTSALAVQNFLPSAGQSQMLPAGNMIDPVNYGNTIVGQLVALTLSVGFDANDPDFATGGWLGAAVINNGPFMGMTVQQLLDEANNYVGGCGSMYTKSQLNTALTMVNENFVDGTTNNGYVDCSATLEARILMDPTSTVQVRTFPVPATSTLNVEVLSDRTGVIHMTMMDALGRTVMQHGNEAFQEKELRTVVLDLNSLNNGSYILTIARDGVVLRTDRVIISR